MSAVQESPKVFISYSWSGAEHEQFVIDLATTLRDHGVDAILDKWRLKPGQDKYVFMEAMVTDPTVTKVLVLCDRVYQEKADARKGGVGTESQIISQELYAKVQQTKFIPVVCERGADGEAFMPVFMKGRIYIDLSSDELFGEGLDEILRQVYDQPLHPEPALGQRPAFLTASGGGLPRAKEHAAAIRAIRDARVNRDGLESLFIRSVLTELDRLYVKPEGHEGYDEEIYQAILKTKALRDQFAEYADAAAGFGGGDPRSLKAAIHLLEELGQRIGPPKENGRYMASWADIYRFFALEAVLILVAALLRFERWTGLRRLLSYPYQVRLDFGGDQTCDITAFDINIASIDQVRNDRLGLNRASLTADMLKERCGPEHTSLGELIQADAFLMLHAVVHVVDRSDEIFLNYWEPRTTVYFLASQKLPLFRKAVDPEIKQGIWEALGVASGSELKYRIDVALAKLGDIRKLSVDRYSRFRFAEDLNLQELLR